MKQQDEFRFVDICAGIGGFHQAMAQLGGACVGAFEIDKDCIETYKTNYPGTPMLGDIGKIDPKQVEPFQVLCAGFPCQPFSKAGKRLGFEDETRGKLFFRIMDLLDGHPEVDYVVLENVRNLAGMTEYWEAILEELEKRDFIVSRNPIILSPSDFGVPQIRERVYILGIRKAKCSAEILKRGAIDLSDLGLSLTKCEPDAAFSILDKSCDDEYVISSVENDVLEAWDEFVQKFKKGGFPHPVWIKAMGCGVDSTDEFYASCGYADMPQWKQNFYNRNRVFYLANRDDVDAWLEKHGMFDRIKIHQKLEWNCGADIASMKKGVIQIRQSGVRVKRPNFYPALVAMVNTPIVWDKHLKNYRHITLKEAAKLQSFDGNFTFVGQDQKGYRQLGNAVNVQIIRELARGLFALSNAKESR